MYYRYYSGLNLRIATNWLIITNILIFLIQNVFGRKFIYIFGLIPFKVIHDLWLWQLLTYMFLHGGIIHLLINLFILWMFGRNIEDVFGTMQFLKYYFICGLGAAILIVLTSLSSIIPTIGASGAIYGLLVAYAFLFPDSIIYLYFFIPIKAKHLVIFLGIISFLSGLSESQSNISHFGHLGGLLIGYIYLKYFYQKDYFNLKNLFGKLFTVGKLKKSSFKFDSDEELELKTNLILDKILIKGVNSLTEEEKNIMDEYIKRKNIYH